MQDHSTTLTPAGNNDLLHEQQVGQAANQAARRHAFNDYKSRKADSTLYAQKTDLATFCTFLASVGIQRDADALQDDAGTWQVVTHGLVKAFVAWLLKKGYAIGTINRKLSTIKIYSRMATEAGVIDTGEHALIRLVAGYDSTEGKRVDERRDETRRSAQKAEPTRISVEDANALKFNPDTPQGRRDTVMMCLLLDHGLRAGELAGLRVRDIQLGEGKFTVYRQKVDKTQTHRLSRHSREALAAYIDAGDAPTDPDAPLLRKSRKGGVLLDAGMSRMAISGRVRTLGEEIGIAGLSAHDCRHYWATRAVAMGTDAFALRDAGGWNSLAMPARYVEGQTIANERVEL